MKKIKVLQIIHSLAMGGAENVVDNIFRNIDKSKFDIEACCINTKGVLGEKLESDGFTIELLKKEGKYSPIRSYFELKEIIKKSNPDIIHTHSEPAFINIGPLYVFNKMPPLVHTYHFGNYPNIPKKYLYMQWFYAKYANELIAVSDSQKDAIIKWHKVDSRKIQTIRNGISENPYLDDFEVISDLKNEFKIRDDELVVGCIAILSEQKGVTYLLDAANAIIQKNKNIRFLIVGGGPLEKQLRDKIEKFHNNEQITFTGWRDDPLKILNIIDIFIQPSLWEAFSIVLLEAMSTRKPIIVTDVADAKKVIKDGISGLIIPPKDSRTILNSLNKFIDNENFRKSAAEAAYSDFINNYTVNKMVQAYENLYLNMIR